MWYLLSSIVLVNMVVTTFGHTLLLWLVSSKPIEFRTVVSLIIHGSCLVTRIMPLACTYVSSVVVMDLWLSFVILACNGVEITIVVFESDISDRCNRVVSNQHQRPLQTSGSCLFGLAMAGCVPVLVVKLLISDSGLDIILSLTSSDNDNTLVNVVRVLSNPVNMYWLVGVQMVFGSELQPFCILLVSLWWSVVVDKPIMANRIVFTTNKRSVIDDFKLSTKPITGLNNLFFVISDK